MTKSTLYVCRRVENASQIIAWAKAQGFETTLEPKDMHVTICYSKNSFQWPTPLKNDIVVHGRGNLPREVKALGDKGAVVLAFDCAELYDRWQDLIASGASWDYATYQPHITITYDGKGMDLSKVEPFTDAIMLGRERFSELDDDWSDKVKEKKAS
jgi:2'-5' RNA ligase